MKKILCILLIFTLLMSVCLVTVSAETATDDSNKATNTTTSTDDESDNWLFYQEFLDTYNASIVIYEELYYSNDKDGNVEWVLIKGSVEDVIPTWGMKTCAVLEDRVVRDSRVLTAPFSSNYGVYDVNEKEFLDLGDASEEEKYHDEIFAYLDENNIGEIIGDMDNDRKVTVKDATYIQKCIANIIEFPENDAVSADYWYTEGYGYLAYLSDFNRDGERNVKDATAIQKHIAGIL